VAAFSAALLGLPQSQAQLVRSDLNCDGLVNGHDIQPFVDAYLTP